MTKPTYVDYPGVESLNYYCAEGYHPVHLGDAFNRGRYIVEYKLGQGSYATVWLAWDTHQERYVSLKIICAEASKHSSGTELEVLRRSTAGAGRGKRYILEFIDSFTHEGPNGSHLCVVTEASGPNLTEDVYDVWEDEAIPPQFSRRFAVQVAQGVEYLHSCNIVHGDLHLGNVLYHSPSLESLFKSREKTKELLGEPTLLEPRLYSEASPPGTSQRVPQYLVYRLSIAPILQLIADDPSQSHIKLCDFGESSFHDPASTGAHRKLNCPRVYAAPEVIFDDLVSPASDVWAMGNLLHHILSGGQEMGSSVISGGPNPTDEEVLKNIVLALGKLPDPWWQRWEERRKYFDEEARPAEGVRAASKLARIPKAYIKEEESEAFEKVLREMFDYNPRTRLTSREVANQLEWLAS